jgi:hypothetical protein
MARANPLWGAPRIHGELQKLGLEISQATVSKYLVRRRMPPSQTWRKFLDNHIGSLVSVDFFSARAQRSSYFFLRAARLRAVFRRRFAGIVAASIGGEGPSDLRRREVHGSVTETLDWTGLAREEAPEPRPIHHARIGASTLLVLSIGLLRLILARLSSSARPAHPP